LFFVFNASEFHNNYIHGMLSSRVTLDNKHYADRRYTKLGRSKWSDRVYRTIQNFSSQYLDHYDCNQ
jgi:hypothetical protein